MARLTITEWNACRDPALMLVCFAEVEMPQLGIFGCLCCRRVWEYLTDDRLRMAIEYRERFERGEITNDEMDTVAVNARVARKAIRAGYPSHDTDEFSPASAPAWAAGAASNAAYGNYVAASKLAAWAAACMSLLDWQSAYDAERASQCELLRSLVEYSLAK